MAAHLLRGEVRYDEDANKYSVTLAFDGELSPGEGAVATLSEPTALDDVEHATQEALTALGATLWS